jgi:hypothetical protein
LIDHIDLPMIFNSTACLQLPMRGGLQIPWEEIAVVELFRGVKIGRLFEL